MVCFNLIKLSKQYQFQYYCKEDWDKCKYNSTIDKIHSYEIGILTCVVKLSKMH